jgi:hypothetical protein
MSADEVIGTHKYYNPWTHGLAQRWTDLRSTFPPVGDDGHRRPRRQVRASVQEATEAKHPVVDLMAGRSDGDPEPHHHRPARQSMSLTNKVNENNMYNGTCR